EQSNSILDKPASSENPDISYRFLHIFILVLNEGFGQPLKLPPIVDYNYRYNSEETRPSHSLDILYVLTPYYS
ncbi:MAG TPA: hypothetical protein VGC12_00595, partial [Methyloradius sp.]